MVSFIVPVYNAETTIDKCLKSIFELNKCSVDYEVIVVNDASEDGTANHVAKFERYNENLVYIENDENRGISVSRNVGAEVASGDYLIFIDSDDYIEETLLCDIEKYINEGVDLIKWNALITDENYNYIKNDLDIEDSYPSKVKFDVCSGSEAFNQLFGKDNLLSCVWCYAIKKSIFEKFPEGRYHEDYAKMMLMILKAKTVVSIGKFEYYYVMTGDSVMRNKSMKKLEKKMIDILFNFDKLIKEIEIMNIDKYTKENAEMYAMYSIVVVENDLYGSLKRIFHSELKKRKVRKIYCS